MGIKYEVTYHYDVWGNEHDGWEVNDSSRQGTIEVKADCTDAEVWAALVDAGIAKGPLSRASIEDLGTCIQIDDAKTGRPTFTLNMVDP